MHVLRTVKIRYATGAVHKEIQKGYIIRKGQINYGNPLQP